MAAEENLVPPAKYIFLIAAGLIILMGVGGAVGFSEFSSNFLKTMDAYIAWERGITEQETGPDGKVWVDLAIDMKSNFNETHGIVYWYFNISVDFNSTLVDVLERLPSAEAVELRIYDLQNVSHWVTVEDENVANYLFDVEYGNYAGYRYIYSIGGVAEDPGTMTEWLTYRWKESTGNFEFLTSAPDKFYPSHGDILVLICTQLGVYPLDCCSGAGFQYEDYTGPK